MATPTRTFSGGFGFNGPKVANIKVKTTISQTSACEAKLTGKPRIEGIAREELLNQIRAKLDGMLEDVSHIRIYRDDLTNEHVVELNISVTPTGVI